MKLDDMRLFARVAEARSFSAAARALGLPKQTVSRRVAELERALGVVLLHRTTRRVTPTEVGLSYAHRCAEVVKLAEEANRAATDDHEAPTGTLRVTADPVFGEAFVTGLVVEYSRRFPEVAIDVVLLRRKADLVEEGFDVAFRIGPITDPEVVAIRLGPAQVRYCASPRYLKRKGVPARPADLASHECLIVSAEDAAWGERTPARWPFRGPRGPVLVPVSGWLRTTSFPVAHRAALAGLGIGMFPEFACGGDLERRALVSVLDAFTIEVGGVFLLRPLRAVVPSRVRAFVDLALRSFATPPWVAPRVAPRDLGSHRGPR